MTAGAGGLAVLAGGCASTGDPARGQALASDVRLLRRAYTLLHPGLYRYNSEREVDLPLIATFPLEPGPGAGIEPEIEAASIAAGTDPAMAVALSQV